MAVILPGLLLGSMSDVHILLGKKSTVKLTHILSIIKDPLDWSDLHPQGPIVSKLILATDLPSTDLLTHFPSSTDFIHEAMKEGGTILVHCEYGMSRSATLVLAYIMKCNRMALSQAMDFVKERKPDIRPNGGFLQQLKLWEKMKYKLDESNKSFRAYKLSHQAKIMRDAGYMETMNLNPDPVGSVSTATTDETCNNNYYYSCRKCRRVLFEDANVLQHELGVGFYSYKQPLVNEVTDDPPSTVEKKIQQESETREQENFEVPPEMVELRRLRLEVAQISLQSSHDSHVTCSSLFIEPVEWMGPLIIGRKDGKLSCPKCVSRIGSFDWSGCQCSCGRWVTPSFQVHKSKIDFKMKPKETPPTTAKQSLTN